MVLHTFLLVCCGLITLGNEIQPHDIDEMHPLSCGLITLGNEIQRCPACKRIYNVVD